MTRRWFQQILPKRKRHLSNRWREIVSGFFVSLHRAIAIPGQSCQPLSRPEVQGSPKKPGNRFPALKRKLGIIYQGPPKDDSFGICSGPACCQSSRSKTSCRAACIFSPASQPKAWPKLQMRIPQWRGPQLVVAASPEAKGNPRVFFIRPLAHQALREAPPECTTRFRGAGRSLRPLREDWRQGAQLCLQCCIQPVANHRYSWFPRLPDSNPAQSPSPV